jgi:hypothetical protein
MTWPSAYPAGTLGYMIDRIDDDIVRSGTLTSEITNAVNDAILIYQKERLRFNETFTATFQTVSGQQNYNALTDASFPNITNYQQFYYIDWMTITVGYAVFDMPKIQPEELLVLTQTGTQMGQPYCYAMSNETIMLYPVPSSGGSGQIGALGGIISGGAGYANGNYSNVPLSGGSGQNATANLTVIGGIVINMSLVNPGINYVVGDLLSCAAIGAGNGFSVEVIVISSASGPFKMTVGGHVTYSAPANLNVAGNRWMIDGERLIRSRAKYELAMHVLNDSDLAMRMSPMDPNSGQQPGTSWLAFKELKGEANKLTGRGVIRPMYF